MFMFCRKIRQKKKTNQNKKTIKRKIEKCRRKQILKSVRVAKTWRERDDVRIAISQLENDVSKSAVCVRALLVHRSIG